MSSVKHQLYDQLVNTISETNGINIIDTIELMLFDKSITENTHLRKSIVESKELLVRFQNNECSIQSLLNHNLSQAFFQFFKNFPIPFHEEHIHLTGSLTPEFIFLELKPLLDGENKEIYYEKIREVYGPESIHINSFKDVEKLIQLKDGEQFKTYLRILYLAKLILNSREAHERAAYSMAKNLYEEYNVGKIRLKFTLSRGTSESSEQIPGADKLTEEDVVLGLYNGFKKFQLEVPEFQFILSPSFRKESHFFDEKQFSSKKNHFLFQIEQIISLINNYPYLHGILNEVDTVGDERELFRKKHFQEMRDGLRRLQYLGFKIRSHHGETWNTLRLGIQAVDNALNIWHIDTLEHGLSLGINPNYYFHRIFQRLMDKNQSSTPLREGDFEYAEFMDMEWRDEEVKRKILEGVPLNAQEKIKFIKTKFHMAREVEHYQHDVLNRMIHKKVSLVALPSSNLKLTGNFPDYKDHPFSWWEKKGVALGVGTDNYITLKTNFIQELLILLYSNPKSLKITKLLMVATKEQRRPFMSHLLWEMRKSVHEPNE